MSFMCPLRNTHVFQLIFRLFLIQRVTVSVL